jgi:hypothetical protein
MATPVVEREISHTAKVQKSQRTIITAECDIDDEKTATYGPDSEFEPAPEGGARAWAVAAGAAAIFFCTLGFGNTFGIFEEYYLTHQLQGELASKISWIGSLLSFLQFLAGMVGGPLFDRLGAKVCSSVNYVVVGLC